MTKAQNTSNVYNTRHVEITFLVVENPNILWSTISSTECCCKKSAWQKIKTFKEHYKNWTHDMLSKESLLIKWLWKNNKLTQIWKIMRNFQVLKSLTFLKSERNFKLMWRESLYWTRNKLLLTHHLVCWYFHLYHHENKSSIPTNLLPTLLHKCYPNFMLKSSSVHSYLLDWN